MGMPVDSSAVLDGLVEPLAVLTRAGEILYVNKVFRRVSGGEDRLIEGRRLGEVWAEVGGILDHARYLHSVATGEGVRFEYGRQGESARYEITVQPTGGGDGTQCVMFREVGQGTSAGQEPAVAAVGRGEHANAGLHTQMLADMGACLRAGRSAAETFQQVGQILGRLPDVARATFGTVDLKARTVTIHSDYCIGVTSMNGVYPMSETDVTCQELGRGEVVAITDVRTDYRSRDMPEVRFKRGYMSCVAIPLMRDGQWSATLMVQSPIPRVWSEDEKELIRTAAERTWLAVENLRLLDEARQANAAKDRFLAMLSHELRTPLTPVVMMLTALQSSEAIPAEVKNDLAMIRRNIDLETRLVDDLLDITRIANGKLRLDRRSARVHELLEHVCQICKEDAESNSIRLQCDLRATCDSVEGDPARLEQVFWNLVKNAIKFTPAGGRVQIRTENRGGGEGGELRVEVRDSGVGIAPEVLHRIFNAFEQGEQNLARTFGGLGLGLAISKAIIDLHGGKIWAQSEGVNRGATFCAVLPVKVSGEQENGQARPSGVTRVEGAQIRSLRVLLVDDHVDTMKTMGRILTRWGMEVTCASAIEEALRKVSAGNFDLLISDIGLPDGSGCELLQRVRDIQPVPAIALSGFGMEADVKRSMDAGFSAHLTKPVSLEQLQEAIGALMGQEHSTRF
jgi:signal transduction histidine kinase/CheY-like chemotaxis protein